jgi:type III secretion protein J
VLDVDKGALVPSRAAEHAQYMAGLAGDLERTLEGIDGVVSARIHLNVAPPDPFRDLGDRNDATSRHSSASVLLEHRGATSPIAVADVQQLIAGGVPTLAPAAVTVVMVPRAAAGADDRGTLAHLGPIAVARSSVRALQVGIAALILLVAVLAGATLVLYARLVRLRASGPSPTAKLT